MTKVTYDTQLTALLVIDPYNDFMSEGGKVWDRLKSVAEANQCVPHMLQVLEAARKANIRVFYALHRRYRPGDYETLEVHCASPAGSLVAQDLRTRDLGRRRSAANSPRTPGGFCHNFRRVADLG